MDLPSFLKARIDQFKAMNTARPRLTEEEANAALQGPGRATLDQQIEQLTTQGMHVSFHDGVVTKFSEKKKGNTYYTLFDVNGFLYSPEGRTEGTISARFQVKSKEGLRDISNREVYDWVHLPSQQQLGVNYFKSDWQQLTSKVLSYDELTMTLGSPQLYERRKNATP